MSRPTWGAPLGVTGESSTPRERFLRRRATAPPNSFTKSGSGRSCRSFTLTTPSWWSFLAVWCPTPEGSVQVEQFLKHATGLLFRRPSFRTWNFPNSAQWLHNVADVLRQQDRLLVGLEGAWNQLGQQLVGGDAGAARQAQSAVDRVPQLGRDVGAQSQPRVVAAADLCVCTEAWRSAKNGPLAGKKPRFSCKYPDLQVPLSFLKATVCSSDASPTHWKGCRRVQKTNILQAAASPSSAFPPSLWRPWSFRQSQVSPPKDRRTTAALRGGKRQVKSIRVSGSLFSTIWPYRSVFN